MFLILLDNEFVSTLIGLVGGGFKGEELDGDVLLVVVDDVYWRGCDAGFSSSSLGKRGTKGWTGGGGLEALSSAHGSTVVESTVVGDREGISLSMSLMEWFLGWMCRVREVADLDEQVHCGLGQLSNGTLGWSILLWRQRLLERRMLQRVWEGVRLG